MKVHYIFHQIFSSDIIFYQSHRHLKNHPCFIRQEKNCIRMEIRFIVFLAKNKKSLLWWKILMMMWYHGERIPQKLDVPQHLDSKTEKLTILTILTIIPPDIVICSLTAKTLIIIFLLHRNIYLVICRLQSTWTPYSKIKKKRQYKLENCILVLRK